MAAQKLNDTQQVEELISNLESGIKETVQAIRKLILNTSLEIAEQIKWNSASFYYTGEMKPFDPKEYKRDIAVCNVHRGKILLVFPTGAKVKTQLSCKDYPDGRKIIAIEDLKELKTKELQLRDLVINWLKLIER